MNPAWTRDSRIERRMLRGRASDARDVSGWWEGGREGTESGARVPPDCEPWVRSLSESEFSQENVIGQSRAAVRRRRAGDKLGRGRK